MKFIDIVNKAFFLSASLLLTGQTSGAQATSRIVRAVPDTVNKTILPRYPAMLASAFIQGTAHIRLVVDTNGRVEMGSTSITASHDLFRRALSNVLPRWRYAPKTVNGKREADTLDYEITFSLPQHPLEVMEQGGLLNYRNTQPDRWDISYGWPEPHLPAFSLDDKVTTAIAATVLDALIDTMISPGAQEKRVESRTLAQVVCVAPFGFDRADEQDDRITDARSIAPTLTLLARLTRPSVAVLAFGRCPRTYGGSGMTYFRDSASKTVEPPAGEDPTLMFVGKVRPWSSDIAHVTASVHRGSSDRVYDCRVVRDTNSGDGWRATCYMNWRKVHVH